MTVEELSPEQYKELCQAYITEFWADDENGTDGPSYYDLAVADELVDPMVICNHYAGIAFNDDDFSCSARK